MKVRALKSFSARVNNKSYTYSQGDEFVMPKGADWDKEGLVEVIGRAPAKKRAKRTSKQAETSEKR